MKDELSLAAAQQLLHANLRDGINCPCCGRFAKVYRRKINASMARALILLHHADGWVHLFSYLTERGCQHSDAALLRHWGFIEARGDERADGNPHSGVYRITLEGTDFAYGNTAAPRYVLLYNDTVQGFSDEETDVWEALGDKFNYRELMGD